MNINIAIKSFKWAVILLIISFTAISCTRDNFGESGEKISENRYLPLFHTIIVKNNINLFLKQDTFYSVEVRCDKNLIDNVLTYVREDSILVCENLNKCLFCGYDNWIDIKVTFPDISRIDLQGSGKVSNKIPLKMHKLVVEGHNVSGDLDINVDLNFCYFGYHSGYSEFKVRGYCTNAWFDHTGAGIFKCDSLECKNLEMTQMSPNDSYINVTDRLKLDIQWNGNIYCYGNPRFVELKNTGKGKLIKIKQETK